MDKAMDKFDKEQNGSEMPAPQPKMSPREAEHHADMTPDDRLTPHEE